ncbi:hypothetical protein [Brevundimonas sp.]|uniref:hypothetical protein n=1 Tax=Brevundimonas sp. TaxID=1871086 RepID=UPI0026378FA1|nr:hypothetical protein [Brevundimonas sp.]
MTNSGRQVAPDEVWDTVKADYLAGLSGPDCCRRHGVSLSALRNRAAREGWRRSDQPWIPPQSLDPWDEGRLLEERIFGNLDLIEWGDLSGVAEARMTRAVLRGDPAEFMRWHKVCEIIDAREGELRRWAEEEEARKYQIRERAREIEAAEAGRDSADYLDSEFREPLDQQGPVRGFRITRDGELVRVKPREVDDADVSSLSRSDGEVDASSSRADGGGDTVSPHVPSPASHSNTTSPPPSRRQAPPRHLPGRHTANGEENGPS